MASVLAQKSQLGQFSELRASESSNESASGETVQLNIDLPSDSFCESDPPSQPHVSLCRPRRIHLDGSVDGCTGVDFGYRTTPQASDAGLGEFYSKTGHML